MTAASPYPSTSQLSDSLRVGLDPIFILTLPRSLSSVIAAMIGQHPQAYGIPETQLLVSETLEEWLELCHKQSYPMAHGLLRAVAQLYFGTQSERTILRAWDWIRQRSLCSTGAVLAELAAFVHPRILVDKSPGIVFHSESLRRVYRMFPGARFIHLTRHPRAYCESVIKAIGETLQRDGVPSWVLKLALEPPPNQDPEGSAPRIDLDPQRSWWHLNNNICHFLAEVPESQKLQIRAEDLLQEPEKGLRLIADWLGLRTDGKALEAMVHPERAPYSCFGPLGARLGNARHFLADPRPRPSRARAQSLMGSLAWRKDGRGFSTEVLELAASFGYS